MSKNAVQRLQKIENDLKSVISIYEVCNKCANVYETEDDKNATQLPQIITQEVFKNPILPNGIRELQTSQFDIINNTPSIIAQPPQDVRTKSLENTKNLKMKKPTSAPLSFSTLSTICEVSYVKAKQTKSSEKQDPIPGIDVTNNISKTNLTSRSKKPIEKKENRGVTAGKRQFVSSRESSILKEYPDWLFQATSNWFGSIKHSYNLNKDKCSSVIPLIPVGVLKNESRLQSPEVKNTLQVQNSQVKMNENEKDFFHVKREREIKSKQSGKIRSMIKQKNCINGKANEGTFEKEKMRVSNSIQKARKGVEHENGGFWTEELSKTIEKNNEKLEKMKVSKELALDIAKYLKEKYDEIQQTNSKLMEESLTIQKDNERLKNELKESQVKIEELRVSSTKQIDQDVKIKEILEENIREQKARIYELEQKLLEKRREINEIQNKRFEEIRNELENKENQGREIQRLSNENNELLAKNDELAVISNDRYLQVQFLDERIRRLEEEVQTQEQDIKIKTKALQETNTELELIHQNSRDLEQQVKLNQEKMNKLQEENLKLKTDLENEKDALLIKTKIIEDQQETIKQLKEKSEDAKSLLKKNEALERILNTEREEKLELEEAVGRLKLRKEELKKKIKDLESDLILAPQKVALDLEKTQTILFELENQVYSKQKEWELQLHSLIREKEQACRVAEYAMKKLIQSSSEFQKQSQAHKRLCQILAENLGETERN